MPYSCGSRCLWTLILYKESVSLLYVFNNYVCFFDFEHPLPLFFTEYLAIMDLFVFLTYYGAKRLQKLSA